MAGEQTVAQPRTLRQQVYEHIPRRQGSTGEHSDEWRECLAGEHGPHHADFHEHAQRPDHHDVGRDRVAPAAKVIAVVNKHRRSKDDRC